MQFKNDSDMDMGPMDGVFITYFVFVFIILASLLHVLLYDSKELKNFVV